MTLGEQKRTVREIRLWPALMGLLLVAGIAHFAAPERFAAIVPTALPGSRHFWVFVSGATEISLAIALQISASRRLAATLAVIFLRSGISGQHQDGRRLGKSTQVETSRSRYSDFLYRSR